ncbi:sigma-54 dependent transcriptional regulator PrdR [Tepidibacter aestuarii]|uniref:sigma-54 dependent transcriptional regulator PrdR n=1 Tax=Tepidibacter aestuarii TaxID=2925782 RepID=UPI0020BF84E9|nr:sigma-54 dependent transcriptional regulator PrdR [Tepidibacter aestuarii]CAH2214459.1 Transcriptional regulator containing PAS, AAA-type ATPase, and DNA-binding Fis domains [Tepidibacter aestuarii]
MFLIPKKTLVKEAMSNKYIQVHYEDELSVCLDEILKNNVDDVYVVDEDEKLIGLLSLTDISKIKKNDLNDGNPIKNFMIKDVKTISKHESLLDCRNMMIKNKIARLPVLENGYLIGVIRTDQIRDYFYMRMEEIGITLDHVINNIHEAVCVIDKDGYVVVWSKNSEKLYNVKSEIIIGKKLEDFFPKGILLKVLKTKKAVDDVYHSPPRKDTDVIVTAQPIFIDGEFVGAVSTDRDITEIKKLSSQLQKANDTLKFLENEVKKFASDDFGNIIGKSEKLTKAIQTARQVAKTNASILILGESGTGKEVFSRAIHDYSQREGLFVPVNCSAIPSELFESEFFGYEAGAFTGANRKGKMGIFELANNGTVFLDEIADLPMQMQAKLLRVLQEKEVRRVGGEKTIKVNVRVISATNKDLNRMIENEEFREDLYYRLNVVELNLPPLRERHGDIVILIHKFLKEICDQNSKPVPEIDPEVMDILRNYTWKGNIRELKNTVEHLVVLSKDNIIREELVPKYILENLNKTMDCKTYPMDLNQAIAKLEQDTIKKALNMSNGNKAKAAKYLNIPRSTLYYKMEQYKIK